MYIKAMASTNPHPHPRVYSHWEPAAVVFGFLNPEAEGPEGDHHAEHRRHLPVRLLREFYKNKTLFPLELSRIMASFKKTSREPGDKLQRGYKSIIRTDERVRE